MVCIYIVLLQTQWPPKRFTYCHTFTQPFTHTPTAVSAMQLGLVVLIMDTWSGGTRVWTTYLSVRHTWTTEPLPPH